jgi:hypothetical protein
MFRWACLVVASVATAFFGWLAYDLGREFKRASQATAAAARELQEAGKAVNRDLREVVENTRAGTAAMAEAGQTVNRDLPEMMDKTRQSAESLNQLARDLQQLRKLVGLADRPRDETLLGYANSVLDYIEEKGDRIGLAKNPLNKRLVDGQPAKQWVEAMRKPAAAIAAGALSRSDYLTALCGVWLIQVGDGEAMPLKDWLRANHPASQALK